MNQPPLRTLALLIAALLYALMLAVPASAHDDGLTCHSHDVVAKDRLWIFSGSLDNVEDIEHSFENRLAAESAAFSATDVAAVRRGLAELRQMVDIVYLLVVRAERLPDPGASDEAMELARSVFEELPLADHVEFEAFQSENRVADGVVLSIDALGGYLAAEIGAAAELIDVVERAARSC